MPTILENKTVEMTLVDLENRYWQAIVDKDVEAALGMTDDPCFVAGANGVARVDRDTFRKMMKGSHATLLDFELKKTEFRQLTPDVALLVYEVHEDLTIDGKKLSMDAAESSVWVRRGEKWLCAQHTESFKGDPYGRDRKS